MSPSTLNLAPGSFVRGEPRKTPYSKPIVTGQKILQELLQQKLLSKISPSSGILASIQDLKNENDEGLLFLGLLQIGQNLKTGEGEETAQWIFGRLTAADSPAWVRNKAEAEQSTWTGGHFGMRAEYLLGRFCKDATDWRVIAPMMGASLAGRFAGTLALGRLSGAAHLGIGVRLAAGTLGYAAEATAFAGLGRAFSSGSGTSFSADLARSALSLGALRLFGALGQTGARFLNPVGTAPGAPAFFVSQFSGLLGLMTAHRLEEHFGLRPNVDGTTLFMDSFASLVTLGVGTRLGHGLAGESYSRLQRDIALRTNFSRPDLNAFAVAIRRPAFAEKAQPSPWLMMSSNSNEGGGGKKGDSLSPVSLPSIVVDPSLYGDPYVGRVLNGRYKIEAVLGKGGGGKVYLATHEILGKKVAIKVLHEKMASDEEATERFLNEAKAVTAIGNPHIVDVNDFGEMPDGSAYYVMEHLDGVSLSKWVEGGKPVPVTKIPYIARQIAEGLAAAHDKGIVHRDLKPDNIFLIQQGSEQDFVKILDFGIAKMMGNNRKLTRTGMTLGTPHYMSPEQALGTPIDARSDVYSLGIVLYEMASGKVPFDATDNVGLMTQHVASEPPSLREGASQEIPPQLESIILKCLEKKPEDRFQSMQEVIDALEAIPVAAKTKTPRNLALIVRPSTETQMIPPRTTRWPRYVGIGGAASLAAIAVAAIFSARRNKNLAPDAALPADAGAAPDAVPTKLTVTPIPPPEKKPVTLEVFPTDAHIFLEGKDLGSREMRLEVEEGSPITLEVRRRGYKSQRTTLDGSKAKITLRLYPETSPKKSPARINTPKPPQEKAKQNKNDDIVSPWK